VLPNQEEQSNDDLNTAEKIKNIGYRHSSVQPENKKSAMAGMNALININN
jgi:hypothetical protein